MSARGLVDSAVVTDETLTGVHYESRPAPRPWLRVVWTVDAARRGDTFAAESADLVIGRKPGKGLRFDDQRMSRTHARFRGGPGGATLVEDMGAKNKVYVGGAQAALHRLEEGDIVRLGDTLLAYELATEEDRTGVEDPHFAGRSARVLTLLREARIAAASPATIVIQGETGTGKDVLARRVHDWSGRGGAYVPVNCGAIPSQLIESTLFGHRRGAFTGAVEHNEGYFVAADRGTLFLDEVAELSPAAQAALLRVLEDGVVTPVGGTRGRKVSVRVVAATHVDLADRVAAGSFRADLFTRLAGWVLRITPLRERPTDAASLIERLLPARLGLTPDAAEALITAPWPGNVRQLKAALVRAEALATGALIGLDALPEEIAQPIRQRATLPSAEAGTGRRPDADELREVLDWAAGNVAQVAERYGRTRKQIYRWIDRFGIDLEAYRR